MSLRALALLAAGLALAAFAAAASSANGAPAVAPRALSASPPTFHGSSSRIGARLRARMRSWRPGCPVAVRDLRLLTADHWGFDRTVRRGRLIVHRRYAADMLGVLRRLFVARFPIRRMWLIDAYGGDDDRSMAADNTSGFNCRRVAGRPDAWSEHAYGRAIDVNPRENPYVASDGRVSPPAGAPYANRSRRARGMIHRGDVVVRAFSRIGWRWGGRWRSAQDYQHFSATGR